MRLAQTRRRYPFQLFDGLEGFCPLPLRRVDHPCIVNQNRIILPLSFGLLQDWRAHAEWLRLSFPGDYRGNVNKIEVSATAQTSSIVLTEEERLELIERQRVAEALPEPGDGTEESSIENHCSR